MREPEAGDDAVRPSRADRADRGATRRKPSVSLTQNDRSTDDCRAWSSVAFTTQRQRPERLLRPAASRVGLLGQVTL